LICQKVKAGRELGCYTQGDSGIRV